MVKLRSVARADSGDLRARVHFCAETGQIWLHEHRMLLVHAEAQASLRKELIDTLGMDRAQGLFTRMGYASGARDAGILGFGLALALFAVLFCWWMIKTAYDEAEQAPNNN